MSHLVEKSQVNDQIGLQTIFEPTMKDRIGFSYLILNDEFYEVEAHSFERVFVLIQGEGRWMVDDFQINQPIQRENVFKDGASALYLSKNTKCVIQAKGSVKMAIFMSPCQNRFNSFVVLPDDTVFHQRGKHNWSRNVVDIIGKDHLCESILVGETFNPPGNWSSYPPHKHDQTNHQGEIKLEEIYYYRINPSQGFGMQGVYSKFDQAYESLMIHDHQVVRIHKGYHPVCAAPGYELYYLWGLSGDKRQLCMSEDEEHQWLHEI